MSINRNSTLRYNDNLLALRAARDSGTLYQTMKTGLGSPVNEEIDNVSAKILRDREEAEKRNKTIISSEELSKGLFDRFKMASANGKKIQEMIVEIKGKKEKEDGLKSKIKTSTSEESVGPRLMSDIQEVLGITKEQAAGIVGNFDYETGGFKYLQEIKPVVPGSKGGRGFAMWTGPRRKEFESWSKENNLDPDSYEGSFGSFIHEVQNTNEGRFIEDLEKATTAEEAARIFSTQYLRPGKPNINQRISASNTYFNMDDN